MSETFVLLCAETHWSSTDGLCNEQILCTGRVSPLRCVSPFRCTNRVSCSTNQDGLIAFPEFLRMQIAPSSSARLERLDQLSTTLADITPLFVLLVSLESHDYDEHLEQQYDGFYDDFKFNWPTFKNFCTLNAESWNLESLKRLYCSLHTQVSPHAHTLCVYCDPKSMNCKT